MSGYDHTALEVLRDLLLSASIAIPATTETKDLLSRIRQYRDCAICLDCDAFVDDIDVHRDLVHQDENEMAAYKRELAKVQEALHAERMRTHELRKQLDERTASECTVRAAWEDEKRENFALDERLETAVIRGAQLQQERDELGRRLAGLTKASVCLFLELGTQAGVIPFHTESVEAAGSRGVSE